MLFSGEQIVWALDKEGQIQDDHNEEEGQALINHEENTEMTTIVVTETDKVSCLVLKMHKNKRLV